MNTKVKDATTDLDNMKVANSSELMKFKYEMEAIMIKLNKLVAAAAPAQSPWDPSVQPTTAAAPAQHPSVQPTTAAEPAQHGPGP